jgi:hypothetical protein
MAELICLGCGGITKAISCNWATYSNKKPRKCYIKWVDEKPVKGCAYDELIPNGYKEWMDLILKENETI